MDVFLARFVTFLKSIIQTADRADPFFPNTLVGRKYRKSSRQPFLGPYQAASKMLYKQLQVLLL